MAKEIYHRSNWGIASNEWGSTYLNADLTNELYKRAGYYENSWATDKILNKIGTKPSIILTPTAYKDGILNSVKPAKTLGIELVTNGSFDTDSDWSKTNATISGGEATITVVSGAYSLISQSITYQNGRTYKITAQVQGTSGKACTFFDNGSNTGGLNLSNGIVNFDGSLQNVNITFTANSNSNQLLIVRNGGGDYSFTIDNVSVKEVTDADFSFTRGSSATRVNEKGLIQDVQILSDELVQNGDFEQIGSELVTNGGFDTDSDWNNEGAASFSIANGVLNCFSDGSYAGISQNIVLEQGKTYKLELDIVRIGENSGSLNLGDQTSYILLGIVDANDNLGKKTIYFTPQITTTIIRIYRSTACDIDLDNVSVKEVGQNWTFGTGWSIEDGKAYYDGVENFKSLGQNNVIELNKKYRLNLDVYGLTSDIVVDVLSGNDFANPRYLTLSNGNVSFEFTATNALNNRFAIQAAQGDEVYLDNISLVEITDDTDLPRIDYTDGEGSLLLEPQSTNLIANSNLFTSWNKEATVTLTANYGISPDGTQNSTRMQMDANDSIYIGKTSGLTASVYIKGTEGETIKLSNGSALTHTLSGQWDRIQVYDSGSISSLISINTYGGPTARDIEIFGAQVEALPYATSYIPTNGTTVTRLADVANNAGNADLINSTEGVLYAEVSALADDNTFRVISLNDGSNDNVIKFGYRNTSNAIYYEVRSGGVSQAFQIYTTTDVKQFHKVAVLYQQNNFKLFINGVNVLSDTIGITPVGLNNISFDVDEFAYFYGNVKSLAVFKEALSDEELQKLTTI